MIVVPKKINRKVNTNAVCNLCGKRLDLLDLQNRLFICKTLGYGSEFNGKRVDLRMCCNCFDRLVEGCDVAPIDQTK